MSWETMHDARMGLRPIVKRLGRLAFWPGVVIGALNIENLAAAVGIDRLLANAVAGGNFGPVRTSLAYLMSIVTSDAAFHVALVLIGVGGAAYIDYLAKRWDAARKSPLTNEALYGKMENLRLRIIAYVEGRHYSRLDSPAPELYSLFGFLHEAGYEPPPSFFYPDDTALRQSLWYISMVAPLLRDGHEGMARQTAEQISAEIKAAVDQRLPQQGTATGTPPKIPHG